MIKYLLLLLIPISLYGCNKKTTYDPDKKIETTEIRGYNIVGQLGEVRYDEVELTEYLRYLIEKSEYLDGYLYKRFLIVTTTENAKNITLEIDSVNDEECGIKRPVVGKVSIDKEMYNTYKYHITCKPVTAVVKEKNKQYMYQFIR